MGKNNVVIDRVYLSREFLTVSTLGLVQITFDWGKHSLFGAKNKHLKVSKVKSFSKHV